MVTSVGRPWRRLTVLVVGWLVTACAAATPPSTEPVSETPSVRESARIEPTAWATPTPPPTASPTPSTPPATGLIAYDEQKGPQFPTVRLIAADGGSDEMLAAGSNPAWSPDGQWIAYECNLEQAASEGRLADVCVIRPDGTGSRLVVADALMPRWSPDGDRILFSRSAIDLGDTWVVEVDGSQSARIGDGRGAWSPDGSWIMLVNGVGVPEVTVVRADGTGSHTFGPGWNATWAPDGDRIASTWTSGDSTEVRAVDIRDGRMETLFVVAGGVNAMAWLSEDRILLATSSSTTPTAPDLGILLADLGSGRVEPIAAGVAVPVSGVTGGFSIAPDGLWVAFTGAFIQEGDGESTDVCAVSLDGHLVQLTTSGTARHATWQPVP